MINAILIVAIAQLGSAWNARFDVQQRRLVKLETRVRAYESIATSPAVLQQALDTLSTNDDVRVLYERGGAYQISPTTILDCRRVAVPHNPDAHLRYAQLMLPFVGYGTPF